MALPRKTAGAGAAALLAGLSLLAPLSGCKTPGAASAGATGAAPERSAEATPAPVTPATAPVRLDFAPTGGKAIREKIRATRTEAFTRPDQQASPWRESVETTVRSRYDADPAGGWIASQQVEAVEVRRNRQLLPSQPMMELVKRFVLKVKLGADGGFAQLLNPGDVEAAIKVQFPAAEEQEQVLAYFTAESLEAQARREWDSRYGGLFGAELAPGKTFYGVEGFGLSSGATIAYAVERKVVGTTPTAHGDAVVLAFRCLGSLDALPPDTRAALEREQVDRGLESLEPSVQCEGQQMVGRTPFFPLRTWMVVRARPKAADGSTPVAITLEKTLSAAE